tara:strand:+ start:199 stop:306 length:108 start_codon:yes stop_codon:yes gene_type:complete
VYEEKKEREREGGKRKESGDTDIWRTKNILDGRLT